MARWKGGQGEGFLEKKWTVSSICNNLKDFLKKKNISRREKENMCRVKADMSSFQSGQTEFSLVANLALGLAL